MRRRLRLTALGLALLAALLLAAALSTFPGSQIPPYAAYLLRARPVADLAGDPDTPLPMLRGLEHLEEGRRVAEDLGLAVGNAYTTVSDDGGGPLVHVVTAAPADRLEPVTWRYPLVGALAYRGYFTRPEAEAFARELRAQGLDTHVRGAPAFSALGWLPEPLPSSTLLWPEDSLVGLVVHECVHRTVFFPGQTEFNETLATYVERQALLERSPDPAALQRRWAREERVHQRLREAADELRGLYRAHPAEALGLREPVFRQLATDLERLRGRPDPDPWNNARLLGSLAYVGELERLAGVHAALGTDLAGFVRQVRDLDRGADPWPQVEALSRRPSPAAPRR